MKSRWKTYLLYAGLIIVGGGLVFILIETVRAKNMGFETKTLWDWMELLIVPLVLAVGAFYLNRSERNTEREIATDRQQEAALQSYIDRMSELLLKEKLLTTKKAEVRDVARTRTLSVMRGLDTRRNDLVFQFLYEAKLINDKKSILNGANMKGMDMQKLHLFGVYLSGARLQDANLTHADLSGANLQGAWLQGANLEGALLVEANLEHAFLARVNLEGAFLMGANLEGAILLNANLQGAYLRHANLEGANLEGANLESAEDITEEQLAKVKSLKGATRPDGTKHE